MVGVSLVYWIGVLLLGGSIGALLGWMLAKSRVGGAQTELRVEAATAEAARAAAREELQAKEEGLRFALEENEQLRERVARLEEKRTADQEKMEWLNDAESKLREAFEALAGQSLQSNSEAFSQRTNEQMDGFLKRMQSDWQTQQVTMTGVVDPLKDNLTKLDSHVRDLEQKREGDYEGLKEQLRSLADTNRSLQHTTVTLSEAHVRLPFAESGVKLSSFALLSWQV